MADENHTPRTVAELTRKGLGPQTHAYDDPDLGPLEFLLAVMHAQHLPMATRIQAASAAAPYTTPRPGTRHYPCVPYHFTYVIGDNPLLHDALREGCEPRTSQCSQGKSRA